MTRRVAARGIPADARSDRRGPADGDRVEADEIEKRCRRHMIRIAISVAYEGEANERGERLIWLEAATVDRLGTMRRPGESYSDAILRLVEMEGACAP